MKGHNNMAKCRCCGNKIYFIFHSQADWAYKINKKYYCSWSCLRHAEKESESKKLMKKAI